MTSNDPLMLAILKEVEFVKHASEDVNANDASELIGNRFKTILAEHVFPNDKESVVTLNTRLEDEDIKNVEDYLSHLANVPPALVDIFYNLADETNGNLPKEKINSQMKLLKSIKSELFNFIPQLYLLKNKEIEDARACTQELEMTLKRTRKAYKTESDIKRLKIMEDNIANAYNNYNQHIKYINVCERGMATIVESYFNIAESILLECKPSK